MLIDLKYHLTSLVAVFLALAVGILAGSSLIAGSSIERQIAAGLEKEFSKLRIENRQQQLEIENLQSILEKHNKFESEMLPVFAGNRLARHRVAIIQTGDYDGVAQSVKASLEEAGADVSSITVIQDISSADMQKKVEDAIYAITGEIGNPHPVDRVLRIIANCVVNGSNPKAIEVLHSKGLIAGSGIYNKRSWRVVIIGGSTGNAGERIDSIDLSLIDNLKNTGVLTIVGTEPVKAEVSYIPAFQSQGIPTVDNVDEPMGQIALISAIEGESGNFGVKKTADKLIPSYLEDEQWRTRYRR